MRVGILGEDRAHEAVVAGLVRRWCPDADVVPGEYRTGRGQRRRRQLRDTLPRLLGVSKCDCVVILVDSNNEGWHAVAERERGFVQERHLHAVVIGAPERNVECWLSVDPQDLASRTGCDAAEVLNARRDDPKGVVRAAFRNRADELKSDPYELVADFVKGAPLEPWLGDKSFGPFFEQCQQLALTFGCSLPNEMDSKTRNP